MVPDKARLKVKTLRHFSKETVIKMKLSRLIQATGLLLTALFTFSTSGAAQQPLSASAKARTLDVSKPVERELAGADQPHSYLIDLKRGDMLDLAVEQRGVDVILQLYAPDGQLLGEYDSPNGAQGDEPLRMFAETGGRYRLEVRPFSPDAKAGRYAIKVKTLRAAMKTELAVVALDKQYQAAWIAGDVQAMTGILADDFTNTPLFATSSISVQDKAAFLARMKSRSDNNQKYTATTRDMRVRDYGDAVIVMGYSDSNVSGRLNDSDILTEQRVNFARTYARHNGRWQLVAAQNTGFGRSTTPFKVDPNGYDAYVGEYQFALDPKIKLTVAREGDRLSGTFSNGSASSKVEFAPEAPAVFNSNSAAMAARFVFVRNESGQVTGLIGIPYISSGIIAEYKRLSPSSR
jgi:ketosteroid isomerase-like protein